MATFLMTAFVLTTFLMTTALTTTPLAKTPILVTFVWPTTSRMIASFLTEFVTTFVTIRFVALSCPIAIVIALGCIQRIRSQVKVEVGSRAICFTSRLAVGQVNPELICKVLEGPVDEVADVPTTDTE